MAYNDAGQSTQVPLSTWGGLCTEMPASNVPDGSSPDCQDVAFRPGAVSSRPGLLKQFATPFGSVTVTGAKTYIDPQGTIRNLYLDSAGNLYVEDVTNTPGLFSTLTTTTPGSYFKSITAFGREYIAISDGLHGTDIPLQYDGTNLDRVTQDGPGSNPTMANLVYAAVAMGLSGGNSMARASNIVTVKTAAAHNLLVGYRAQISDMTAATIGTAISSIVINNENLPGIATVTTTTAHGLTPGVRVNISGVNYQDLPGGIIHLLREGQAVTIFMSAPHGLSPGAHIAIVGTVDNTFLGSFTVEKVNSPSDFSFTQAEPTNVNAGVAAGNVRLLWPTAAAQTYEVIETPTATSFQVQLNYANGTWTSGTVTFEWDGTFFVATVPSSTTFTYKQNGPNATTSQIGKVTPNGQIAPGEHQMRVSFLTRAGYVTAPSPPIKIVANGGQYLSITNIPIGPANVVARILQFTGAQGAYFFYIPTPAQVGGQQVSTATQINDNTTTSVVLDFSDNTLFASLGTSIPGNNLPAQIILEGALGFGFFGSRLLTYGQRNRVQSLLNMGFDGGYLPSATTLPTGWTAAAGGAGGNLAAGHYGSAWQVTGAGSIFQSGYLDAYGAPILTPNTRYRLRGWVKTAAATATVTISSVTSGFTSSATLTPGTAAGAWLEGAFSLPMPPVIPTDMIVSLSGTGGAIIDELSIIYAETPYLDRILYGSYVNNPEGFDGLSGKFGPAEDTRKIMDFGMIRSNLYILTQDPSGRLHSVSDNQTTEPAGWPINQIAAGCGLLSAFALTKSQADDQTAAGGEEWLAWASAAGPRIFSGNEPWKIGQEIYPDWQNINPAAFKTMWTLNDISARRIYFGLPTGTNTAPNIIYPVDYKELDSAFEIAQASPVVRGGNGRMSSRDHCRKWTRWNLSINGAAMTMRNTSGPLFVTFLYGNGSYPNTVAGGCGNVYILCDTKLTDDCFGQIFPYYVTAFLPGPEMEQELKLGAQRKMLAYFQCLVAGQGIMKVTPLLNNLSNPSPLIVERDMRALPNFDDEWPGGSAVGQRIAFKFESLPGSL